MKYFALSTLIVFCAALCRSQSEAGVHAFFKEKIGLNDSEVAQIDQGKAAAKVLQSSRPSQVFIFGAIFIKGEPATYVAIARDLDKLRSIPGYLAVHRFSTPPQLSDLADFSIDPADVDDLKDCKPGDCEIQLPAENIDEFRRSVNWSAPDATAQMNELARKMALDALLAYQKGGNAALGTYHDKKAPTQVSEQFSAILARSNLLPEKLPALVSYLLNYPKATLPNSSSVFYWEKVNFGLKPTVRINQHIVAQMQGERGPIDVVAIKQLYASHYFQTALDLNFCVPEQSQYGFYLITLKGSEQAGFTGPKGAVVRKVAVDKTRSSLEKSLQVIKTQVEQR